VSICLYCGIREAGDGRNAHQLCRQCRDDSRARRKFPPKRGGPGFGHTYSRNQPRDRFGRFHYPGELPQRYDYPDEVA
jgi:hypothetical protein